SDVLHRIYKAADGWLFLAARPGELKACKELAKLADKTGARLEHALEEAIKGRSVAAWVETLTRAGMGTHEVVIDLEKLMQDPLVVKRGLSITREHEVVGPVTTNGTSVRLSRTPVDPGAPARKPGADAASVLAEIGMEGELERLVREK